MSDRDDPIRRAVADGDTACPDGQALARLGELVRGAAQPPRAVDLVDVLRGRAAARIAGDDGDDAAVDAAYDLGLAASDDLARIGDLVRRAATPPDPIDLVPAMRRRMAGASRRLTPPAAAPENRWRVVSAVAAAHIAALLVLTLWSTSDGDGTGDGGDGHDHGLASDRAIGVGGTGGATSKLPGHLPADWRAMAGEHQDLLLLRRDPAARADARRRYRMEASADLVAGCLAWLEQRQDPETGAIGALTGQLDRDLAAQALAALALAGEGLGTSPVDLQRVDRLRRSLGWLVDHARDQRHVAGHDLTAAGIASLALVEGALLLEDDRLAAAASEALAELDGGLPTSAGASGLGGFSLLAIETAAVGGLPVPPRAREAAERIGRSLPAATEDPGRLGLALFARFIYGKAASAGSQQSLAALGEHLPIADETGAINPLQWFFATLALREAGGDAWIRWSQQLQFALRQGLVVGEDGTAWMPAASTRYADAAGASGDVFATSLVALNLQVPYRYLPLAPAR